LQFSNAAITGRVFTIVPIFLTETHLMYTQRPFEQFNRLRHELDRAFGAMQARSIAFPLVNVAEDDAGFYVEAELPGMKLEDLEILIENGNELTIKGSRSTPKAEPAASHEDAPEASQRRWHLNERRSGSFSRTLTLSTDIDVENVTAELKHGVLTVSLPKCEAIKPKRIEVQVKS
jgi:HSP20 family protein